MKGTQKPLGAHTRDRAGPWPWPPCAVRRDHSPEETPPPGLLPERDRMAPIFHFGFLFFVLCCFVGVFFFWGGGGRCVVFF